MAISATATKKETQFLWEGKDKRGNKVRGKSLAANEAALRADLRRQGVAATRVKTQSRAFRSGGKITNEDIAVFSRQLATMMSAGIPMVQAFEIIGNGHEKPAMQKLVLDVKANIEGGSTLHESLAKYPAVLRQSVRQSGRGRRASGCARVAARQDRDLQGKNRGPQEEDQEGALLSDRRAVRRGHRIDHLADLRHPAVRSAVQGLRRRLAGVHADGRQSVPLRAASRLVAASGDRRQLYTFFYFLKRSRKMQLAFDRILLKFPIIGPILVKAAIARFARTLSTMFAAGVPLVEAMQIRGRRHRQHRLRGGACCA